MLGLLRRASLLGVPGLWRKPLSGPRWGRRSPGPLRHSSAGGKEAARRWEGAGTGWSQSAAEEPFVFPEYLPEKPEAAADARPLPAPEEEAKAEPEPALPGPRRPRLRKEHRVTGAADPSVPSSGVPCSGCGAELHCRDAALAGYLPSEKYRSLVGSKREEEEEEEEEGGEGERGGAGEEAASAAGQAPHVGAALEEALCQRCWLLTHHQKALRVRMSPEEYRQRVSAALQRRPPQPHGRPPLVLYLADLLDLPDSVLPDLPALVGPSAHVFVLGNKVDLLPGDSPGYLRRLRERLRDLCVQVGLVEASRPGGGDDDGRSRSRRSAGRVVDVHLISARTGYGVEELINKLQSSWKFNGDVYLVGSTNAGKSTLFNTLLHSDYCKSKASDVIRRATVSPWPGTTLNLLKFPIITPTPYRIFQRKTRLQEDAKKTEDDLSEEEQKQLQKLKKYGYLIGRVGRTFKKTQRETSQFEFDAEAMSYSLNEEPLLPCKPPAEKVEFTEDEVKYSRWFYDTPGIVRDGCILNLLDEKEVKLVLPTQAIVPRTFVLKPGMTLFLGSLGRIDYLQHSAFSQSVQTMILRTSRWMLDKAE
ncbi:nitric oxide-associated protein 1 isoform X2 [Pogona vitticeps]